MTCEKCGAAVQVGEWPFCPHGVPNVAVVDDTVIGGRWCETLGHEPFFYTSKSELQREAARRGLECVGGRKPDSYFAKQRQMLDEKRRDLKLPKDAPVSL